MLVLLNVAVSQHCYFLRNSAVTSPSLTQSVGLLWVSSSACNSPASKDCAIVFSFFFLLLLLLSCFQMRHNGACAVKWSSHQPVSSGPTSLTCNHGLVWEYEWPEVAGQRWRAWDPHGSDAAGARPGPVCPSKDCLFSKCGPAEPPPAWVPGHWRQQRRGLHGFFCPVLPTYCPAQHISERSVSSPLIKHLESLLSRCIWHCLPSPQYFVQAPAHRATWYNLNYIKIFWLFEPCAGQYFHKGAKVKPSVVAFTPALLY